MSVRRLESGSIVLEDECPVEDAETLFQLLQATPEAPCDWTQCGRLHTAVLQVLLVARPALRGPCADSWLERWFQAVIHEPHT
jgi:hypothetical protein